MVAVGDISEWLLGPIFKFEEKVIMSKKSLWAKSHYEQKHDQKIILETWAESNYVCVDSDNQSEMAPMATKL